MRAALVGIDGTGKSTVLRQLRERGDVNVVHAIRSHEDPDSPFADLSSALADASAAADAVGRAQLKVAVLYLQLTLYAPAEARVAEHDGSFLLADRHPLIDPLVYLPIFAHLATEEGPGDDEATWWSKQDPRAASTVREWLRTCSGEAEPWALGSELLRLAAQPPEQLLTRLMELFGVALPDAVVMLDLPVDRALQRTRDRARGEELHETAAVLSAVRRHYDTVLTWLPEAQPQVGVARVDADGTETEVADRVWAALGSLVASGEGNGQRGT